MEKGRVFETPFIGSEEHDGFGVVYVAQGDYSVIISCLNPILEYAADRDAYYSFHQLYSNLIKTLGVGYTLQKQDILVRKSYQGKQAEDYLSKKYNNNFHGRQYTDEKTFLIITRKVKRSSFFKYDLKEWDSFKRNVDRAMDILQGAKLEPRLLTYKETTLHLKKAIAFNYGDQSFLLDNFVASNEGITMGEHELRSISLVDVDEVNIPGSVQPYRDMNDLGYSFPTDFVGFLHHVPEYDTIVYNQVITIPDQQSELTKLQAKKKRHISIPDPANNVCVEDIDALLNDVAKNSQLVVYSHFNIMVKAHKESIQRAVNYIESSLFNCGIFASKNSYNQLELFRSALPGNSGEMKQYDQFFTTSDAAICFFFKERLVTDEKSNFQIYFTDRQGIPVAIDTSDLPMETGRINNRNKFVLGPSGSGKSFFMNALIRQYKVYNMDVVLVDTGHSYSGLCQYYGGRYITYTDAKPITMNPFRFNEAEYNEEKREFLKSLIGVCWKGSGGSLNQIEDSVLSQVIKAFYTDFFGTSGNRFKLSFNSFYEYSMAKIADIITEKGINFDLLGYKFILEKFYKGGEFESILNDDFDSTLFEESFIVFEIDAIKEHKILFPITTIIIMDVFLQKMRLKKNRKALIIEEAWKAIASPMMAGYILYLYKTVRKFWGEAVVVTQELADIVGNAVVKDSIVSNSDTICLLDQSKFKDNYDQVAQLLSLSDIERKKIFTVNNLDNKSGRGRFKEVYIRRGATGEVYGVEVSLHEYLTYTTESKEKLAVSVYVNHYGDFIKGLDAIVTDYQKSGLKMQDFFTRIRETNKIYN